MLKLSWCIPKTAIARFHGSSIFIWVEIFALLSIENAQGYTPTSDKYRFLSPHIFPAINVLCFLDAKHSAWGLRCIPMTAVFVFPGG